MNYDIRILFLLFLMYSFTGWAIEVIGKLIEKGKFVNRGFLVGPYCPIYGVGCLSMILLLNGYINDPFTLFIMSILLFSFLEYFTSYFMEKIFKIRWWDYSRRKFNINGRICLEGLLVFGLAGCAFTYVIAPILDNLYSKIKPKVASILCVVLISLYLADLMYTKVNPNTGVGISEEVEKVDVK